MEWHLSHKWMTLLTPFLSAPAIIRFYLLTS